jgi:hypothetical protein
MGERGSRTIEELYVLHLMSSKIAFISWIHVLLVLIYRKRNALWTLSVELSTP